MRVIANIPHEEMKISVFSWNGKYLIKLEKGGFEQTYKISEMDFVDDAELEKMLDEEFLEKALDTFKVMMLNWREAKERLDSL
jgi:hypothetical protein